MHEEGKSMLFICMCVHEDMKKIPARPLLIDYGLAGMGLVLSRIDSGVSGSPFLVLRSPFLPLMEEKEQKKIKASGTPAELARYQAKFPAPEGAVRDAGQVCRGHQGCQPSLPGAPGVPAKFARYLNSTNKHLINSTPFTFRFLLPRWPDRGGRRLARLC